MEPVKIVVHFTDGGLIKGFSNDFFPNKEQFHLTEHSSDEIIDIDVSDLKAIFFVKDFEGKPDYQERKGFLDDQNIQGRKVRVIFQDGEAIVGSVLGYDPKRQGFFVIPADPESNNSRIFVVVAATTDVEFF
jgi:hypothetical protein